MSEEGGWKGEIFLTLYLFSCMVLMLNFLIALLSVVYSNLADQSKALYLSKIIEVQPRWVFHSKFNLFSLRVPPLNLITLFALPCFKNCSIKSRELIEKVQYLPVYFITLAVVRQALHLSVIVKEVRDELPFTCTYTDITEIVCKQTKRETTGLPLVSYHPIRDFSPKLLHKSLSVSRFQALKKFLETNSLTDENGELLLFPGLLH